MEKKPEKHSKTQKTDKNGTKTGKSKFKYILKIKKNNKEIYKKNFRMINKLNATGK